MRNRGASSQFAESRPSRLRSSRSAWSKVGPGVLACPYQHGMAKQTQFRRSRPESWSCNRIQASAVAQALSLPSRDSSRLRSSRSARSRVGPGFLACPYQHGTTKRTQFRPSRPESWSCNRIQTSTVAQALSLPSRDLSTQVLPCRTAQGGAALPAHISTHWRNKPNLSEAPSNQVVVAPEGPGDHSPPASAVGRSQVTATSPGRAIQATPSLHGRGASGRSSVGGPKCLTKAVSPLSGLLAVAARHPRLEAVGGPFGAEPLPNSATWSLLWASIAALRFGGTMAYGGGLRGGLLALVRFVDWSLLLASPAQASAAGKIGAYQAGAAVRGTRGRRLATLFLP